MKIPFGEFAPDIAKVDSSVATVAKNVVPVGDKYYQLKGVGGSMGPSIVAAGGYPRSVWYRENHSFAIAPITVLHPASGGCNIYYSSTDITQAGGLSRWFGLTPQHDFVEWDDAILVYGNIATPQKITASVTSNPSVNKTADIANSPRGSTAAKIRDFVVLGYTYESATEYPYRVKWSEFDNYEGWTAGTNQSDFQDLPEGGDIVKIVGGEVGIVLQEHQVVRMTYVGSPIVFQFDVIEGGRGCISKKSVVEVGGDIYYLSSEGFVVLRAGSTTELIGRNKVDNYFWRNAATYSGVSGVYDEMYGCIFWGFQTSITIGLPMDTFLIYNISTNRWSTAQFGTVYAIGRATRVTAGVTANSGYSNIGMYAVNGGDFDYLYLAGDTLAATIETGEFSQDDALTEITEVRPIIDGTATVTTETRNLLSDSVTSTGPTSTDSTGKANVRTNARYTRIKCTTSGDFTEATGVEVKLKKGGKR